MSELKCCPFCGGEAKICNGSNDIIGKQFLIRCKEITCTIRPKTDWHTSLEEAIKHWNTRTPMANIVEKLEEEKEKAQDEMEECIFKGLPYHDSTEGKVIGITKAINIVNQEINNGLE